MQKEYALAIDIKYCGSYVTNFLLTAGISFNQNVLPEDKLKEIVNFELSYCTKSRFYFIFPIGQASLQHTESVKLPFRIFDTLIGAQPL